MNEKSALVRAGEYKTDWLALLWMEWSWDTNVKNGRKKSWRTSLFFPVHSYQMYGETIQFSLKAYVSRESGLFSGFS